MSVHLIENVTVVPGRGRAETAGSVVVTDGVVSAIEPGPAAPGRYLLPGAVDLHLDNLAERRRPRATVVLGVAETLVALDAECAAAGVTTVCITARCEDNPGKGITGEDAADLAHALEELAPRLACDWRLHARVEITDPNALAMLDAVLVASTRVALVSVMEHSLARTRFASAAEHRAFYAQDWGVSEEEVDAITAAHTLSDEQRADLRRQVAERAADAGVPLASHDDRTPEQVADAHRLGASVAEFPLSAEAAVRAAELGMVRVLGAPNAVRGRSTSSGNILVRDAVRDGLCDILCSDYLPGALQRAPFALATAGVLDLAHAVDLVSVRPATVIGADSGIDVGRPLTGAVMRQVNGALVGEQLWRGGELRFARP